MFVKPARSLKALAREEVCAWQRAIAARVLLGMVPMGAGLLRRRPAALASNALFACRAFHAAADLAGFQEVFRLGAKLPEKMS